MEPGEREETRREVCPLIPLIFGPWDAAVRWHKEKQRHEDGHQQASQEERLQQARRHARALFAATFALRSATQQILTQKSFAQEQAAPWAHALASLASLAPTPATRPISANMWKMMADALRQLQVHTLPPQPEPIQAHLETLDFAPHYGALRQVDRAMSWTLEELRKHWGSQGMLLDTVV